MFYWGRRRISHNLVDVWLFFVTFSFYWFLIDVRQVYVVGLRVQMLSLLLLKFCPYPFTAIHWNSLINFSVKHFLKVSHSSCLFILGECSLPLKIASISKFFHFDSLLSIPNLLFIAILQHLSFNFPFSRFSAILFW